MAVSVIPTPCRFVLYHFVADPHGPILSRPALVTSVRSDGRVNIAVFFEPGDSEHGLGTSPQNFDNFRLNIEERSYEAKHPGTWSWPPRV
ncbi:MAG: hypothetical protein ACREJC_03950 [Tepidisphaeraceae bacterium]